MRVCSSLLDGGPAHAADAAVRRTVNPAVLDEVVAEVDLGDAGTFADAATRAHAAQPAWADVPAPVRGRAIQQLGRLVEDNLEALARLITREIGKPLAESRGEVQEVVDTCTFFLGEGRRLYGQTVPSEMPDKWAMSVRAPVGVAGVITPWNFPFAIPSWKLMPALVAGNTAVFKPAGDTPEMAWHFTQIFEEAGLPAGTVSCLTGSGRVVGDGLAMHPGVDGVTFTGLAGTGDLVATVLASGSRNRRAGEMLAAGTPAGDIAPTLGQAAEAVGTVPLLADRAAAAGVDAPALTGLAGLIDGTVEPATWTASLTAPAPPHAVRAA